MAHGGARPGAGKPKGSVSKFNDAARAKAAAGGITPLAYLLGLLRADDTSESVKIDVAKAAAPYMHARLAAVEHSGDKDKPIVHTVTWEK
jgi:hypothetical protein